MKHKLYTVWAIFLVNFRRVFRDRTALFFTFFFPLVLLVIFGLIFGRSSGTSFSVALINESSTPLAKQFVTMATAKNQKLLKVDQAVTTTKQADEKMSRSEIDATIILPPDYGTTKPGQKTPSGTIIVNYTQNNAQAAAALVSVLKAGLQPVNARFVNTEVPFTVESHQSNQHSLTQFDYSFTGLLGFAILGMGIFGPMNVFPELKKMGILRRLHTTPLRVWQYFMATMMGQAVVGLMSLAAMFIVAIIFFHLKVVGSYLELVPFLILGIIMILGIGLSLGGWAKNERQVAPLANIIVLPMMLLGGTFIPRYIMPEALQNVTGYLPIAAVIDGARLIATEGKHLTDIGPQLGIIGVWLVIVYIIAFRVFRWE